VKRFSPNILGQMGTSEITSFTWDDGDRSCLAKSRVAWLGERGVVAAPRYLELFVAQLVSTEA